MPQHAPVSLDQLLAGGDMRLPGVFEPLDENAASFADAGRFLALSIPLVAALHEVHRQRIIHGALNPAAVLLDVGADGAVGEFAVQVLPPELAAQAIPTAGSYLAYVAPEQTGRMNLVADHRSDLYALGVIFYQMLSGTLPFTAADSLALVHAHMASEPAPPAEVCPHVPLPLSNLVLKLLAKDPRDRYQSAAGLRADLQRFQEQWQTGRALEAFALGSGDRSDRLLLPQALYGREPEQARLLAALDAAAQGSAQLLFLSGAAGVGKTALLGALAAPVGERQGLLLSTRAEQRRGAHAPLVALVAECVAQLLLGDAGEVARWRARLTAALSGNTVELLRQVPDLAFIIDEAGAAAARSADPRLLLGLALQSFFQAVARHDHPLVLVLEDAQWLAEGSLQLLRSLAARDELCLLVVLSYRSDAVLPEPLAALAAEAAPGQQLELEPLRPAAVSDLLAAVLYSDGPAVDELAAVVYGKTGGNPFFLREYLLALQEQAMLTFDVQRRVWQWNLAAIEAAPVSDNVVDLVRRRLQQLPRRAQQTLKAAAVMGRRFEAPLLFMAVPGDPVETGADLLLAAELGAVAPLVESPYQAQRAARPQEKRVADMEAVATSFGTPPPADAATRRAAGVRAYQFVHEQVREAARLLLPELDEAALHRQIGQALLQKMTPAQRERHIFFLVRHLNAGSSYVTDRADLLDVAQLNLQAAREALALVADVNAFLFATAGIELLRAGPAADPWREDYELSRDLHLLAGQAAARAGQFEMARHLQSLVGVHATSVLDQATATQVQMFAAYLQGEHAQAVAAALAILPQLGVRLPAEPSNRHLLPALARTRLALLGKPIDSLDRLPPATDETAVKALQIMAAASISAATVNPRLLILLGLEIVRLTQRHGVHPLSAIGYALYGLYLCGIGGDIDRGYAFGRLALRLMPQIRTKEYRVFVNYFVHAHINHWKEHVRDTLQPLRELPTSGEFEYLAVAAGLYPYFTWFISELPVGFYQQSVAENMHLLEPFRDTPLYYRYLLGQQFFLNLLGAAADPCVLSGEALDEALQLERYTRENDRTSVFYIACHKLILCYLFEDYALAGKAARLAHDYADGGTSTPLVPVLSLYEALSGLAGGGSPAAVKLARANLRDLRRWAKYGPANGRHRCTLLEAELARTAGETGRARELYDEAIAQAGAEAYLPELALAHEVAGRFYAGIGQAAYATHHVQAAREAYSRWGAAGKVRQLEARHAALLPPAVAAPPAEDPGAPQSDLSASLDVASVLKATQVLAAETALQPLLETLTQILVENAGAQDGYLLLPDGDGWTVAAASDGRGDELSPFIMQTVGEVAHRHEALLLNDLPAAGESAPPRSVLCLPLLDKGELAGVFYMENRLTRDAFPPERLQPLTMLATQAAISLKNAALVTGLQEAQDSIQASEQRFRLLFENAPLGIFEIDISGEVPQIRTANRRAEATYGWPADELASVDPALLIPEESRSDIQRLVATVGAGRPALLETTNLRRDGSSFPVRIIATPAHDQRGLHMIVAVEDVSAERQRRSEAEAIDAERRRIAQEIHDGVAQDLASLRLKISLWRDWVEGDPERLRGELDLAHATLNRAIEEIRRSIYAMRPVALDEVGLLPALRSYVADFNEQHQVYVDLQIDLPEEQLPPELELALFRVAQEALSNVGRHADASLAWIALTATGNQLRLTIRDNGRGFDPAMLESAGRGGHLGLKQMGERVAAAGGRLTLKSAVDRGTEIAVVVGLSPD